MKRENLPLALVSQFLAAQETLNDKAALGGAVSFSDDILVGGNAPGRKGQVRKELLLIISQWADATQLTDKNVVFGMKLGWFRHAAPF